MERLQKVIANRGYCSRRKAEELIVQGRVTVNGEIVDKLGYKTMACDIIEVDGVLLEQQEFVYYLLNKPTGVISSVTDEFSRPVVTDFIETTTVNERIFPVGRLDMDTTGIILLTNDGDFMQKMTHPKFKLQKTYVAKVKGIPTQYHINKLTQGLLVDGKKSTADDAYIISRNREKNTAVIEITLHEGRYHLVKRMFAALELPVYGLKRVKYGCLDLDFMPIGTFRKLKKHEVNQLLLLSEAQK